LDAVESLLEIEQPDVEKDKKHQGDLNLTSVDAIRIAYDLIGRGVLSEKHLAFVQKETGLTKIVKPILHSNQYFHLLKWLKEKGVLTEAELAKARELLQEESYSGI
jgi:hypothetical protein